MLIFAESFFAWAGLILFLLGLCSVFIPRHFRLGVLTMLTGDVFFALAIVYPKRITDMLLSHGVSTATLSEKNNILGLVIGLLVFALFYALRLLLKKYFQPKAGNNKTAACDQNSKAKDDRKNSEGGVRRVELANNAKTADPKLFSSVGKKV